MLTRRTTHNGFGVRVVMVLFVLWLVIGAIAAGQRHYFSSSGPHGCAKAGDTIVTILAGPLNYAGVNPQIRNCQVPQPSR